MAIFQKSVIKNALDKFDKELLNVAYDSFKKTFTFEKIERIKNLKEEEYQDGFLRDLFVHVFGYTLNPDDNYNLVREFKNIDDGKKADGAILKDGNAIAVIELKSTTTKDLKSVTQQAFNYKNNQQNCKYVITSNFQKLRFYIDSATEFEEFDLFNITKSEFDLLFLLLSKNSIFSDLPIKLKNETELFEKEISDKLYDDYSNFKNKIYKNLIKNNLEFDKLTLFKTSQKLLDRFLFILFAEDCGLLPPNIISQIIDRYKTLKKADAYKPIYSICKQYFGYIDVGKKEEDIPEYNGGLFAPDKLLDNLKIDDSVLIDDLLILSEYDFSTEIDVNILGHIFEHSLKEIEKITAKIEGITLEKSKTIKQKDGVFYTPAYITKYIVENTIGKLCDEKRLELGLKEIEIDDSYKNKNGFLNAEGNKLEKTLKNYKKWLLELKIIDPACGSGAFLNQALNFLIQEHKIIDDIINDLTNMPLGIFDTDVKILENNLYGVDINEESVEIAKLSLWLCTAQKGRKLCNLNNNIKCGNSLIDDKEIAREKAFDWHKEFSEIMEKGGFDVVIGNPPYVRSRNFNNATASYFIDNYKLTTSEYDLSTLFIERLMNISKKNSISGFITSNKFFTTRYGAKLRKYLIKNKSISNIINFKSGVFKDTPVETSIIIFNSNKNNYIKYININKNEKNSEFETKKTLNINYSHLLCTKQQILYFPKNHVGNIILNKIENSRFEIADFFQFNAGKGITNIKGLLFDNKKNNSDIPVYTGKSIWRYISLNPEYWIKANNIKKYNPLNTLLIRELSTVNRAIMLKTSSCFSALNSVTLLISNNTAHLKSFLIIFNSNFFKKIFELFYEATRTHSNLRFKEMYLKNLPIGNFDSFNHIKASEKADKMLELNEQLQKKKTKFLDLLKANFDIDKISKKLQTFYDYDFKTFISELKKKKVKPSLNQQVEWKDFFSDYKTEINLLQFEIKTTDEEIDKMVYKLYDLTDDEINIVENN